MDWNNLRPTGPADFMMKLALTSAGVIFFAGLYLHSIVLIVVGGVFGLVVGVAHAVVEMRRNGRLVRAELRQQLEQALPVIIEMALVLIFFSYFFLAWRGVVDYSDRVLGGMMILFGLPHARYSEFFNRQQVSRRRFFHSWTDRMSPAPKRIYEALPGIMLIVIGLFVVFGVSNR